MLLSLLIGTRTHNVPHNAHIEALVINSHLTPAAAPCCVCDTLVPPSRLAVVPRRSSAMAKRPLSDVVDLTNEDDDAAEPPPKRPCTNSAAGAPLDAGDFECVICAGLLIDPVGKYASL